MITISSYLHRQELADIMRRWMYGAILPGDTLLITRLVHFNHVYVTRYLRRFSEDLFRLLHGDALDFRPATRKGELKDILTENPSYRNERIDTLIRNYKEHPERFYRETPFQGTLIFRLDGGGEVYVGSNRIKRIRRLAEKAARRIVDRIYAAIKQHATTLANERALRLGIPREQLFTPPEEMLAEFLAAEERLTQDLRQGRPIALNGEIAINDVAGVKVICENEPGDMAGSLAGIDSCRIVEQEKHAGRYNATNWIVEWMPPKEQLLREPFPERVAHHLSRRGLSPGDVQTDFADFVYSGEPAVRLEIIVSTFQEALESEIGRSIHEDRVMEQRLQREYRGHLAKNIEYLMEYLFRYPYSHCLELTEVPIKLWNRYLPDYFDEVLKELFRLPSGSQPA